MSDAEKFLIIILQQSTPDARAIWLQSFIQEQGPLSEEAAVKVREILKEGALQ